ncbi:hypothetical protein [Longimycelium tulufanense]|uniref:hypothetical protein n=1 Tax=Longimycelium tulufanense TaxID=907463 RepID=UPI001664CD59|nr:hypothetical protein [Longimycelium tulufanense]
MDELRLSQEIEARFRQARRALTTAIRARTPKPTREQWRKRVAASHRELAAVYEAAGLEVGLRVGGRSVLWEALLDAELTHRQEAQRLDPAPATGVRS